MAKLSDDLKRILNGLAYEDAGEFLSTSEKMEVLNSNSNTARKEIQVKPQARLSKITNSNVESSKVVSAVTVRRIAFISNGEGINAPLDYAIESCLRQNAQIDLLVHDVADTIKVAALEMKIRNAGVRFQQFQIDSNPVDYIINYIAKQTSLIFMIAMPVDTVVKKLVAETSTTHFNRIDVPFVLINDETTGIALKQTAA